MKVLVLNQIVKYFTGSEINAIQICEALQNQGVEADIGTFIQGEPLNEVILRKGIKVIDLLKTVNEPFIYDLVWAHHAPTLAELLFKKEISDAKIIFSSLSPIVPLECVPVFHKDIHYFLSHSQGNTDIMVRDGVPAEKIHYFPNFVPGSYFPKARVNPASVIRKIAVVSNHVPDEVRVFANLASKNSIQVDFYGTNDRPEFVDDHLLLKYDLVISIGKTVQYCFGLKVPIYVYDHFGGPGYLNQSNYEITKDHNFSGRNTGIKRSGAELFEDITAGYQESLKHLDDFFEISDRDFNLDKNITKLLNDLKDIPVTNIESFRSRNSYSERVYDPYLDLLRENLHLHHVIIEKGEEIDDIIYSYRHTVSWKITSPLRWIRSNLGNLKKTKTIS